MKRVIKIVVIPLMCGALLFLTQAGFAQTVKNQPIPTQDAKFDKVIKGCSVPYITTKKLCAVVEISAASSSQGSDKTEKNRSSGQIKQPGSDKDQTQTVRQVYEYAISPTVEVREKGERGSRSTIETLAAVGYITKADIYVLNDEVVKIIIVDMEG